MTASTGEVFDGHVPDGEFWDRFFPAPAPGEDTVYFDTCFAAPGWCIEEALERGHGDRDWFWVVWWRGRPAVSGWAATVTEAATAAASSTAEPVTHRPGAAALYLTATDET